MKRDWPVRETWRASFIFWLFVGATASRGRARPRRRGAHASSGAARRLARDAGDGCARGARRGGVRARAAGRCLGGAPGGDARGRRSGAGRRAGQREGRGGARPDCRGARQGRRARGAGTADRGARRSGRVRAAVALAALAKSRGLTDDEARARLEALLADRAAESALGGGAGAVCAITTRGAATALLGCIKDVAAHVRATCAKALADVGRDADADAAGAARRRRGRARGGGGGAHVGQAGPAVQGRRLSRPAARCRTRSCRGALRWCRR